MFVLRRLVVAIFCLFIGSTTAPAESRVALVIGNSFYQHTAALQNPRHDAADMAAVLRGLGFRVIEGLDLDKAAMERTIRGYAEALSSAKVGLFFYAGHGLQVSGENYLVPIDAKLETASALEFEAVRLQLVQRVMEAATATNVLFLDACRDNPLARNLARTLGTRSSGIGKGLSAVESGAGTLVSFSTQPGNVALDGAGRNSPFSGALVHHLTSSNADLSTILIDVRNTVMANTGDRQVPWEHSALRSRLYLHAGAAGEATTGQQPQLSEVAQAWAVTKESRSEAALGAFIARYQATIFGDLARARLKELEKESVKSDSAGARPATSSLHPFDGIWQATWKGNQACPLRSGDWPLTIQGAVVHHSSGSVGSINAKGELSIDLPAKANPRVKVRHHMKLAGNSGSGTFQTLGSACAGTTVLKRGSEPTSAAISR